MCDFRGWCLFKLLKHFQSMVVWHWTSSINLCFYVVHLCEWRWLFTVIYLVNAIFPLPFVLPLLHKCLGTIKKNISFMCFTHLCCLIDTIAFLVFNYGKTECHNFRFSVHLILFVIILGEQNTPAICKQFWSVKTSLVAIW